MKNLFFKILAFILCLPSGGILLLKAFGYSQMYTTAYSLFLPSIFLLLFLVLILYYKDRDLFNLIIIGAIGGLIGTIGYDLIRIPFMLIGSRIFAPINMYGVWLTDAAVGNAFTDTMGWLYHFSNGITFGIMYALFMKGKSYWWAIGYALLLETIFVVSPFGELFGLTSKPLSLLAAYIGHIAYGYPLGKMTQNFTSTISNLKFFKKGILKTIPVLTVAIMVIIIYSKTHTENETRIVISNQELNPHIIRISSGDALQLYNKNTRSNTTVIINGEALELHPNEELTTKIEKPGIYQVKIKDNPTIKSIFILNEPVEKFNQIH